MYTKTHFKVNIHRNTFTNTLVCLCINGTETLVVFVGWAFICHKSIQYKQGLRINISPITRNCPCMYIIKCDLCFCVVKWLARLSIFIHADIIVLVSEFLMVVILSEW